MSDTLARKHYGEAVQERDGAAAACARPGKAVSAEMSIQFAHVDAHLAEVALALGDGPDFDPWHITDVDERNTILAALSYIHTHTGSDGERARVSGLLERLGGEV